MRPPQAVFHSASAGRSSRMPPFCGCPRMNCGRIKVRVSLASLLILGGCSSTAIAPKFGLFPTSQPSVYSDADWVSVLQGYVHDGLVDYEGLSRHRDALYNYYALLS